MREIFFIPGQEVKTCSKDIERQIAPFARREKTRYLLPFPQRQVHVPDPLFEQQGMTSHEEFILKGLFGIGDLWPGVFNKILNSGGKPNFYLQHPGEDLLHDVSEPGCNLMRIDQQHVK
jgi:hypothetical protein